MYQTLIQNNQQLIQKFVAKQREYYFDVDLLALHKIIAFVGPRRAGKTYIMLQTIQNLIKSGKLDIEQIVFLDATEIDPMTFDANILLQDYFSLYPDTIPFFVIDEVHELPDFTRHLFVLYNRGYQIFISGSNAHVLSSELSTKLRGKVFDQRIYPLNRSEYCIFVGYEQHNQTSQNLGIRQKHFQDYLMFGGFPEIALAQNEQLKKSLLKSYMDVLVYKDLIERYKIDKEYVIKYLIKRLGTAITKQRSTSKVIRDLASQGVDISKPSMYNYLEYLQNIFYVYPLNQIGRQRGDTKFYLMDTGYLSLREQEGFGKRMENLVISKYVRGLSSQGFDNKYGYNQNSQGEIDFVGEDVAVQVCRNLTSEDLARETEPLLACNASKKLLIYQSMDSALILPQGIEYQLVYDIV